MTNAVGDYFDGLNLKLFDALPVAGRVLEFGCANGRLGAAYKTRHPDAHWTGVDKSPQVLAVASRHLDRVIELDLDTAIANCFEPPYDLIVFGDLIEHLRTPLAFLRSLWHLAAPEGRLVCCIPNANHISVVERLLVGDLSTDRSGLLDDTHLRFFSPASAIKTLLDGGWMPSLVDSYRVGGDAQTLATLREAAVRLGSSSEAFERNVLTYQMVFDCLPIRAIAPAAVAPEIAIVVPVSNALQYQLNIARSPGVGEMGADLIPVYGATSAADGFHRGRVQTAADWILYCHQDVYLPVGAGTAIVAELAAIPFERRVDQIVGFIGLTEAAGSRFQATDGLRLAGTIVDRLYRLNEPPTDAAISIDECIVAVHRECRHSIDPALGWHLWATDLVWSAERLCDAPSCKIINVPAFHNSLTAWTLTPAFEASIEVMFGKYPERDWLHSLCGSWTRHGTDQPRLRDPDRSAADRSGSP